MKLNKVVLNNIFSFYKEEIIHFDNLTFIIAQNGLGKTSILNAIKLCLGYSNIEISSIFNNNSNSDICSVSVIFNEFTVSKSWDVKTLNETLKIKFEDGEYLTDAEANDFIKEKIPFFLIDLLFYDGELNSNILFLSNNKLQHLFEFIFDLDLLKNMSIDSLKASKELLLSDDNKDISSNYNKLKVNISNNDDSLNILKDEKLSIEANIKLTYKEVQKLDRQIRQESKQLNIAKEALETYNVSLNEKISLFKKAIYFEMPLLLNKKLHDKMNVNNKPILEVKNQNEFNKKINIFSQSLKLENKQVKELFNNLFLNNSFDINLFFSLSSFRELLVEIKDIQNTMDKFNEKIKIIENNESKNEQFTMISDLLVSKSNELNNLQNNLFDIDDKIINLIELTKRLEKELTSLYRTKKDSFATIQSYEYLVNLAGISSEIYTKELSAQLIYFNEALKGSTMKFREIYSQIKSIYIADNLAFEIIDLNDKKINIELLSAGQKQVLNFLIITTILEFKKFNNFLIVDTPFGRLSTKNRDLIFSDCYIKFDQLSLLLTDSEFDFLKSKNLSFKKYEIFKNNLGSSIKENK